MRKRPLLPFFYVGLAAATVAGVGYALGEPPRQSCRLPDGSTVILEGITYGAGEHRFAPGSRLRRSLALALLPGLASLLRCEPKRHPPPHPPQRDIPRMVCWFDWKDAPSGRVPAWSVYSVSPDGTENLAELDPDTLRPEGGGLVSWPVTRFPRELEFVTFHLYQEQDGKQRRCGVFRVPNPSPGPFPSWTPERLPASKRMGDVRVTLAEVGEQRFRDTRTRHPPWRALFVRLRLRTPEGKPSPWRAVEVVVSDPMGNEVNPGWQLDQLSEESEGEWVAWTQQPLPPGPAWKVTVHLALRSECPAPARVTISIPAPGKTERLDRKVPVHGGWVVLETFQAPGEVRLSHGSHPLALHLEGFRDPEAAVWVFPEPDRYKRGLLRPASGSVVLGLDPRESDRSVSLTFERQYTRLPVGNYRTVEFIARPTVKSIGVGEPVSQGDLD